MYEFDDPFRHVVNFARCLMKEEKWPQTLVRKLKNGIVGNRVVKDPKVVYEFIPIKSQSFNFSYTY